MSAVIWTSDDDGIDLGNPLQLFVDFAELARVAPGEDADFAELFAVPQQLEEQPPAEWLDTVREQAAVFLDRHGEGLSPGAVATLRTLAGGGGS